MTATTSALALKVILHRIHGLAADVRGMDCDPETHAVLGRLQDEANNGIAICNDLEHAAGLARDAEARETMDRR